MFGQHKDAVTLRLLPATTDTCAICCLVRGSYGSGKQGLYLRAVETSNGRLHRLLERDQPHLRTPLDVLRGMFPDISRQRMNGAEPLIAGSGATVSRELELVQK